MIYLTRFVVKGKTAMASRLWFVSFCTYVVYYWLSRGNYIVTGLESFYFALLWPIPAILSFWLIESIKRNTGNKPAYRWMVYFFAGVVFSILIDSAAGVAGWYTYNNTTAMAPAFINPVSGNVVPALAVFMLGLLMVGVFFLTDIVFDLIKKKYGPTLSTYILIGMAFILGGLVWVATEGIATIAKAL